MYHWFYSFENATKNLFRTKGIWLTFTLVALISCFNFISFYLLIVFKLWERQLEQGENTIAKLPVTIFGYLLALLFLILFIFLISYTKRTFQSLVLLQANDIQTASFLGDYFFMISFEYAIQPIICLLLILPLSASIAKKIVHRFITDFMSNLNLVTNNKNDILFTFLLILLCCTFVFFSNFLFINRLIRNHSLSS